MTTLDRDAVIASADLIRRCGARGFEFGYLHDDVPSEDAEWWAHAMFEGRRVSVEKHRDPITAIEELARILIGLSKCRRCGKQIVLDDEAEGCRWRRMGPQWEPGCDLPIDYTIPVQR